MVLSTINPSSFFIEANQNLGAVEIGTFVGLILFGVSLSQGYTYFRRYAEDRNALKNMVYTLLCLETCHSFTAAVIIYYDTVTRFTSATPNSYPISVNVVLETLITFLVQCFFSFRIHRLSQRPRISISAVCFSLSFLRFIGGIAIGVELFLDVPHVPNGIGVVVRFSWLITSALTCGAAADILIAASMTYYLRKLASPANRLSTTMILKRLIRFALQTGLITSLTSVTVITCFQGMPNMIWFGLYIVLAKLYSNSLLVSLNARPRRPDGSSDICDLPPESDLEFSPNSKPIPKPISISFQIPPCDFREWTHTLPLAKETSAC